MPITNAQREQIGKLLGMSGSENDHEALAHLRKAADLLKKHGVTWADLVKPAPATKVSDALSYMHLMDLHNLAKAQVERLTVELGKTRAALTKAQEELAHEQVKADVAQTKVRGQLVQARKDRAALQAKLDAVTPPRDPWQDTVEAFLDDFPETDRWAAFNLLDALGVQTSHRDTDTYRRLARVMRAIGGWKASNNVVDDHVDHRFIARVRGYIRVREI
jgi:multidrug efflux pump subunit AcrA (membrane-fusion protein)